MRSTGTLVAALFLTSIAVWGQEKLTPLNVKTGLWEVTSSRTSARQGRQSPPETRRSCLTKDQLEKGMSFVDERTAECTRTVVTSTSSKLDVKFTCDMGGQKMDGQIQIDALTPESVKGATRMTGLMNTESNFTGRWIASACGDVK